MNMTPQAKPSFIMTRPWGWMVKFIHTTGFWVKLIYVAPGQRTSDQLHHERTEYHINFFRPWRSLKIPVGMRHRMTQGLYLELAFGKPREEDIVRFADDYGRA